MYVFGITGGVGSGKSEVLRVIKDNYNCDYLLTDDLAKELMKPGHICYDKIHDAFIKDEVFDKDGYIVNERMAKVIYDNPQKRIELNSIVHPEVRNEVIRIKDEKILENKLDAFFIEAALIIEENYKEFCDDLWYVFAKEDIRRHRLKLGRGYSDEKIDSIMASQQTEAVFREHCRIIIDNNEDIKKTEKNIDFVMENEFKLRRA